MDGTVKGASASDGGTKGGRSPPSQGRIEPDQPRLLFPPVRSARPTLVEVPLSDLFFWPETLKQAM